MLRSLTVRLWTRRAISVQPWGSAQAFDGANPPGCHYDNDTLCKGGYHINMKGGDDALTDEAKLYKIPDGKERPEDGTVIWSAERERHTRLANKTAEFWTFTKEPGYHYQATLHVDVESPSGHIDSRDFTMDPEADQCYTTMVMTQGSNPPVNFVTISSSNSDKEPGSCNLK